MNRVIYQLLNEYSNGMRNRPGSFSALDVAGKLKTYDEIVAFVSQLASYVAKHAVDQGIKRYGRAEMTKLAARLGLTLDAMASYQAHIAGSVLCQLMADRYSDNPAWKKAEQAYDDVRAYYVNSVRSNSGQYWAKVKTYLDEIERETKQDTTAAFNSTTAWQMAKQQLN